MSFSQEYLPEFKARFLDVVQNTPWTFGVPKPTLDLKNNDRNFICYSKKYDPSPDVVLYQISFF